MKYCKDCWGFDRCKAQGRTVDFPVDDGVCCHFDPIMPMTNADCIRAMTDEELARFIANNIVNLENHKMIEQGHTPTATQLSALGHTCYCTLVQWLKQPSEGDA